MIDTYILNNYRKWSRDYGFFEKPNPIFIPKKHTKQTYAAQQRAAKRRRNVKTRASK